MGSVCTIQTPLTDVIFGPPLALWSAKTTETSLLKTALSSWVEEDLRKERISLETEEPSGPDAAKVSAVRSEPNHPFDTLEHKLL